MTADDAIAERARLLRSHGMTSPTWRRHRGEADRYDVVAPGFNYRIDEPRATLGLARLRVLDEANARRAELDAAYRRELAAVEGIGLTLEPPRLGSSACHLFAVLLPDEATRDRCRARLAEEGVQTSVHYPPVHAFTTYASARADAPLSEEYARRALTLPLFPHMSEEQLELVVGELRAALRRAPRAA